MSASAIAERLAAELELEDSSEGTALVVNTLRNMSKIFHEMATTSDV